MFTRFIAALERRHLATLTFPELRRAVQALSSLYVERRQRLAPHKVFDGAGKRAAFAAFYAPLHFLLVEQIVQALHLPTPNHLTELGCGTAAAGAAWVGATNAHYSGYDVHPWVTREATWTLQTLGIKGRVHTKDLFAAKLTDAVLAAFTINELQATQRDQLLQKLLSCGAQVLIVEPIAKSAFWPAWEKAFVEHGGRSDEWRFRIELPEFLQRMDRAAGLDHRELTGKSLWLPARQQPLSPR